MRQLSCLDAKRLEMERNHRQNLAQRMMMPRPVHHLRTHQSYSRRPTYTAWCPRHAIEKLHILTVGSQKVDTREVRPFEVVA